MYIEVINFIFFQLSEKEHSKVKGALDSQWAFSPASIFFFDLQWFCFD